MSADRHLAIEEIRDLARFEAIEAPWNQLLAECERDIPFLRHEWLRIWWKHFGRGARLAVFWVLRDGQPVLAVPLFQTRGHLLGLPLTVLRSMTNEHSFRFDVLLRHGEAEAPAALVRHLAVRGGWDVIQLRDVVWPGEGVTALIDAARGAGHPTGVWPSYQSPFLTPHATFEEYRNHLKPKFQGNLRNRRKRLSSLGAISFEVLEDARRALALLPAGLVLEGSGWKHETGSSIASDPTLIAFYTELAELAGERGWLRLHFLRLGGRAIAFDYSLRYGGRYYCLKIGYEPEFAPYSPGQLLKEAIIERIFAEGCREYDFLGPIMEAKADWQPSARRHAWLFLYARGWLPRIAHAEKFGLRPALARFLRR